MLLHPQNSAPMQSWKFKDKSLIRIGRATDNEVVLYSSVVSRLHLELRETKGNWQMISRGANGTFVGEERISQVPVVDGTIFRIAPSVRSSWPSWLFLLLRATGSAAPRCRGIGTKTQ